MKETSILEEALDHTRNSQQKKYAHPILNFARIAQFWVEWLEMRGIMTQHSKPLTPEDVAQMMVLFKIGREVNQHTHDNLVDEAGYTDCAARINSVMVALGYAGGINDLRAMSFTELEALYDTLEASGPELYEGV